MARIVVISSAPSPVTPLSELLVERGADAVTCCDGKSAFATLSQEKTDLLILDLASSKPESGWNVLTFLQLHPILRRTPVIVCSGETDETLSKEEWLKNHGIDLLFKPFDIDDLYQHVDMLLRRDGQS